jgi:CRP/FNR family transcriptional regulator, cyclic AMP receptor protein
MPKDKTAPVDWESLLVGLSHGKTIARYGTGQRIFNQGEPAEAIYFIRNGGVKLSVIDRQYKESTLSTMNAGDFFGEGCLADQQLRLSAASAITDCSLIRIEKLIMMQLFHENHEISELFVGCMLSRNIQYEAKLADQLLSEQPQARFLLLLAQLGRDILAQMPGTNGSGISPCMN